MNRTTRLTARISTTAAIAALTFGGLGAVSVATADSAAAESTCITSERVKIKEGYRGINSVKEAQCRLNVLGYGLEVDGVFGDATDTAVRDFQSKNGLTVDGVVGTNTWAKLVEKTGGGGAVTTDQKIAAVVGYARAQLGKDYHLGEEGPTQFDCSGLTQMAYKQAGISLPRHSTDQHVGFTEVSASDRRPGDLIWWTGKTHVGIYVGNGQLIDASNSQDEVTQRAVYSYGGPARYFRVIR